ncbi:hypothetical protein [Deminuibacter soli]|uniref:Periplasmic heavy metal sensor n=1 Tax=Deminuibacter soli TaxID=2291815 RepID=A0A3E1NDH1_9BACT|nr:hypothetical protein [Deminuibacter soli]RFM26033.1 hypothetical protein DXN05_22175 [Deminuibacter soli]
MKKIIACLVMVLSLTALHSYAQDGGGDRAARMQQMKEMQKQRLKDSLQIDDAKAEQVVNIQFESMQQQRTIWQDQSISADDKKSKMADLSAKTKDKLKTILTDDQITKLEAMQRNRMRQGGPGGRGGRGGDNGNN